MLSECPLHCACEVMNLNIPLLARVICSNLGLKTLPEKLPKNTKALDVSRNKVSLA